MTVFRTGVAGNPVEHSHSPELQEAAGRYAQRAVASRRVVSADPSEVAAWLPRQFDALSITTPLKSGLLDFCNPTPEAVAVGAVNTLRWHQGRLEGHCTDGTGFVASLREDYDVAISEARIRVLGAGGASRPIVHALQEAGCPSIEVVARRPDEARFASSVSVVGAPTGEADVIVNATSAGLSGELPSMGLGGALAPHGLIYDLTYAPEAGAWSHAWRAEGASAASGLSMLLWQAQQQFSWWFDLEIPIEVLRMALS